ncbi:MAG: hypothetical protein JSS09_00500 [Verrucomicrobia bacterium]|nr:hypothetical protein [Verrucomicrobiota bacterium]
MINNVNLSSANIFIGDIPSKTSKMWEEILHFERSQKSGLPKYPLREEDLVEHLRAILEYMPRSPSNDGVVYDISNEDLSYILLRLDEIQSNDVHDQFVLEILRTLHTQNDSESKYAVTAHLSFIKVFNKVRDPGMRTKLFIDVINDRFAKKDYFSMMEFLKALEPSKMKDDLILEIEHKLQAC